MGYLNFQRAFWSIHTQWSGIWGNPSKMDFGCCVIRQQRVYLLSWQPAPCVAGVRQKNSTAAFLLTIPKCSIQTLGKSWISRWSLEVWPQWQANLKCSFDLFVSKSRPWNLMYENIKYENDRTANLRTTILDFRGFGSSRILISRGGILMTMRNFLEVLSQRIIVRIILVGRLGVVVRRLKRV